jgi:hypothetical protein
LLYSRTTISLSASPYIRTFNDILSGEFLLGKFPAVHIHGLRAASRHLIHGGYVTVLINRRLAVALATSHEVSLFFFGFSHTNASPPSPPKEMSEVINLSGRLKSVMNNK